MARRRSSRTRRKVTGRKIHESPYGGDLMQKSAIERVFRSKRGASRRKGKSQFTVDMKIDSMFYEIHAGTIVERVGDAVLEHHYHAIIDSVHPGSGARQPDPKWTRNSGKQDDRYYPRNGGRGYKSGEFARNIQRARPTGTYGRAAVVIGPGSSRAKFVGSELKFRGIEYFAVVGEVAELINEEVAVLVTDALAGQVERYGGGAEKKAA